MWSLLGDLLTWLLGRFFPNHKVTAAVTAQKQKDRADALQSENTAIIEADKARDAVDRRIADDPERLSDDPANLYRD